MIKALRVAWLALIIIISIYSGLAIVKHQRLQVDLLDLLPKSQTQDMQAASLFMQDADFSGTFVLMVGHEDPDLGSQALQQVYQDLSRSTLDLKLMRAEDFIVEYTALFKQLYPYRAGLLANSDYSLLIKQQANSLVDNAMLETMAPFSTLGSPQLKTDPFYLFPKYVLSLRPLKSMSMEYDGKTWHILKGNIKNSSFSLDYQKKFAAVIDPVINAIQAKYNVAVLKTGAIFYAISGAQHASNEISLISSFSLLGIIICLWLVFGTLRPLGIALVVILSGITIGVGACLLIFGSIHLLALVFGCTLVGVCVDYAIHYYCASYKQHNGAVLAVLMPALPLSVLSSCLGYGLLLFVPFPGIQQMAVLAAVGLAASFISVCLYGPLLVSSNAQNLPPVAQKLQTLLEHLTNLGSHKNVVRVLICSLLLIGAVGILRLKYADDIRNFQALDPALKQQETQLKKIVNFDNSTIFLNIEDDSLEKVLTTEEQLIPALDQLIVDGHLTSYRALASLQPSVQRQTENRALSNDAYTKFWPSFSDNLGLNLKLADLELGLSAKFLTEINDLPTGWSELIHYTNPQQVTGRILLSGVTDATLIAKLCSKYAGVSYIDQPQTYSGVFATYRHMVLMLVMLVILAIMLVLAFIVGWRNALNIIMPVSLALLSTIAILSMFNIGLNLFHAMGLLLVLCIGVDYAIFLVTQSSNSHILANVLAATTTIFSFGFLCISSTMAVSSFGIAVFLGIILSFVLSTILIGSKFSTKQVMINDHI